MDEPTQRVSGLLHEAGEVHHVVYRITDGADDDWASLCGLAYRSLGSFPTRSGAHRPGATSYSSSSSSSPNGPLPRPRQDTLAGLLRRADHRPLRLTVRRARCASTLATDAVGTASTQAIQTRSSRAGERNPPGPRHDRGSRDATTRKHPRARATAGGADRRRGCGQRRDDHLPTTRDARDGSAAERRAGRCHRAPHIAHHPSRAGAGNCRASVAGLARAGRRPRVAKGQAARRKSRLHRGRMQLRGLLEPVLGLEED